MTIRSGMAAALLVVVAANQPALAQRAPTSADRWRAVAAGLEDGTLVEVHLRDGSRVRGTLVSLDETAMQVLPHTRVPVPVRAIAFRDVDVLDQWRKGLSPGARTLVVVGSGVSVMLAVTAAVMAARLD